MSKRKVDSEPYERPFQQPLEKLEKDVKTRVRFPSRDEKFGSVSMGWRLPGQLWEVIPTIQVNKLVFFIAPFLSHFLLFIHETPNLTDTTHANVGDITQNGKVHKKFT